MKYTAPNGDVYAYALFWSQISNGTDRAMKVKVSFPVDAYEVPSLPGEYFKILVPPDTMTVANESLFNFGLMDLNGFLDNNMGKKTSLERTVGSKGSTGFYVVMLRPIDRTRGALRAGLSLKGQSLFYKISQYTPTKALSLMKEQEIQVGSIDLKNLKLRE